MLLDWTLVGTLLVYLALMVTRNTRLAYSPETVSAARRYCEDKQTDISDSRLSNFGSDSGPELNSSEVLSVDRVFPLTRTMNRVMDRICKKFTLHIQLEDKKVLPLKNHVLNLTLFEALSEGEEKKEVFATGFDISRLDTLRRLGNAYISENTDEVIVLNQGLRFQILKYSFDLTDNQGKVLGSSSFIYEKNMFLLKITISTSYDNSNCVVKRVDFIFVPDSKSFSLKVKGFAGTPEFYAKLKSLLLFDFEKNIVTIIQNELLPLFRKLVDQADVCSFFDAKDSIHESSLNVNSYYF